MDILTTLRTLKSRQPEDQERTLQLILDTRPHLGTQVRSFVEKQIRASIFAVKPTVSDTYLARIALLSIHLADIATIPDRSAREVYMQPFRELCRKLNVEEIDIKLLSKNTVTFENILEKLE